MLAKACSKLSGQTSSIQTLIVDNSSETPPVVGKGPYFKTEVDSDAQKYGHGS